MDSEQSIVYYDGNSTMDELAVQEQLLSTHSSPKVPITRTVAIIKNHALEHRFDIERRIQEAGFEIVKERQMEFDTETDPEALEELFGEDTYCLAEGPVWVYILERRRAVEVWHALMGPRDPAVARHEDPTSLRAVYGLSSAQNALMGSPDLEIAEIQIASLFASSPPFPTSDLPPEDAANPYDHDAMHADILDQLARVNLNGDGAGYAPSNATNPSTTGNSSTRLNANGKPAFKARAVPASAAKPDIVPRMTRAASLRIGQPVESPSSSGPRKPVTKERLAQTFANVPGHKRAETISVASTAAPAIAPRMTRAAALRLGIKLEDPVKKKPATADEVEAKKKNTFEGVPGHKRRESISVASVKAPTVAPRLNKSASLRVAPKAAAPPTSFMFKGASPAKTPGSISRANSLDSGTSASAGPVTRSRSASQASNHPTATSANGTSASGTRRASAAPAPRPPSVTRAPISRRTSSVSVTASKPNGTNGAAGAEESEPAESASAVRSPSRARPSSVCGASPSIAPRMNRSAALRAAKMEAEAAAASATALKKAGGRVRAPPSSFKAIAT